MKLNNINYLYKFTEKLLINGFINREWFNLFIYL